jgi:hypothetical protein
MNAAGSASRIKNMPPVDMLVNMSGQSLAYRPVVAFAEPVGVVAGCTGEREEMKQLATSRQMVVARGLAKMASDDQIQYTPTGFIDKVDNVVWHEMSADGGGNRYTYWLRRDWGSVAGGF